MASYVNFKSSVLGKAYDVDGYYGAQCPIKGTMIAMIDGSLKPVEELKTGDIVSTGNRVITNKPRKSKIIKVKTESGTFKVSPDHKFILTDGQEVKAKDLKADDEIEILKTSKNALNKLTADELKFLGFYLADGTKSYRYDYSQVPEIFVTVGTLAKINYLKNLDVALNESTHSNGKAKIYRLINKQHPYLTELIEFMDGKKLPQIFSANEYNFIIEGYLQGDGSIKRNSVVASSVCKELLVSIQHGCFINGWRAILSEPIIRESTNYCDHPKPIYKLTINKNKKSSGKVKWTKELEEEEIIYILNLDGNHLYFGDNHLHHNCWDGYAWYCKYLGYPYAHCTSSGYVKDIWTNRKSNGTLDYFEEVSVMQAGDVAVFKEVPNVTPYSHVAIFDHDAGGGYGYFLGQNQGASNGAFNVVKLPYSATYLTAFRPKCFVDSVQSGTTSSGKKVTAVWDQNATIQVGDIVKSVSCAIQGVQGNCVKCSALGGLIPLAHVSEAADTKDGKCDDYLATTDARIILDECKVTAVDAVNNLVKVHGYWVKTAPLMVKC